MAVDYSNRKFLSVHDGHCCPVHGCKYGDRDCTVELKIEEGIFCEECDELAHYDSLKELDPDKRDWEYDGYGVKRNKRTFTIMESENGTHKQLPIMEDGPRDLPSVYYDHLRTPDATDRHFLDFCLTQVAPHSLDPDWKVGAVATIDGRLIAMDHNRMCEGIPDDDHHWHDDRKSDLVHHAERNLLDRCQNDLSRATLYTTLYPCSECAKSIITRGIMRIVTYEKHPYPSAKLKWDISDYLFEKSNTSVFFLPRPVDF